MKMEIFKELHFIEDLHIVGGFVRDMVMGITPHDMDLASPSPPSTIIELCDMHDIKTIPTGIEHGTVTMIIDGKHYEHTTYRKDVSTDGRNATVEFAKAIEEDLSRRDFTMNAMALNSKEEIIDPFDGQNDIKNGIIRTVGDAEVRFKEDYLRIIRAARFAASFNFKVTDEITLAMHKLQSGILEHVSIERIVMEFNKVFNDTKRFFSRLFLIRLFSIGFLYEFLPELKGADKIMQNPRWHPELDVLSHIIDVVGKAPSHLKWHALLHDVGKIPTAEPSNKGPWSHFRGHDVVGAELVANITKRLKFPGSLQDSVYEITRLHMTPKDLEESKKKSKFGKFQYDAGMYLSLLEEFSKLDSFREEDVPTKAFKDYGRITNVILGSDLFKAFPELKEGKYIGELVSFSHTLQLNTGIVDKDRLLEHIKNKIEKDKNA